MSKFFLVAFACFINVVSFGQTKSDETVVYNLGTMVMFEEWTTDHVILPVKQTDVEKRGLKGPVIYFNARTLMVEKNEYGYSETEILKETIEFDFNEKQISCQKLYGTSDIQKFEFEFDKNGFIKKAKLIDPCSKEYGGTEYYNYDSMGNLSAIGFEDADGYMQSITLKFYNKHGELLEEKTTMLGEEIWFWEEYKRSAGKIKIHDKYTRDIWRGDLNEKGDIVRLKNRKRNQIQEFTYIYDSWGNWTEKNQFFNGEKVQKEYRKFYYAKSAESVNLPIPTSVRVGKQIWMNENLDIKNFNNGDAIIQAQCEEEWEKAFLNKTPAWCYCEDGDGNLTKDVLYNYYALKDSRGLAPAGYRIATLSDWNVLFNEYGGLEGAFEKLKDPERDDLNTAGRRGYRHGNWLLPESYWWTKDEKKICLAVDNVGKMLIFENQGKDSYFQDGLLLRCVKE